MSDAEAQFDALVQALKDKKPDAVVLPLCTPAACRYAERVSCHAASPRRRPPSPTPPRPCAVGEDGVDLGR